MAVKILFVIPELSGGGAQRLLVDICHEMMLRGGYQPHIAVLTKSLNRYAQLTGNIPVHYFDISRHVSIFSLHNTGLKELKDFVSSLRPDIIHSHIYFADLIVNRLHYQGPKYFSHIHGPTTQYDRSLFWKGNVKLCIISHLERALMLQAYRKNKTRFLCVSNAYTNYTKKILPELKENVHLQHNGALLSDIAVRKKRSPQPPLKIISVGRLTKIKDFALLIDTADAMRKSNTPFVVDIYGEGELQSYLQQKIDALQLTGIVNLLGFSDHIKQKYCDYDLYLHTALQEPFGLTIVEAMASGLPVVCTDAGGNRDIVTNDFNGYITQNRSPEELAELVIKTTNGSLLYERLSQGATQTAKNFSIEKCVNHLIESYSY